MAKGFLENKDRKEAIGSFGKSIGKRAGFKCEWCESKDLGLSARPAAQHEGNSMPEIIVEHN
jgi:hypothetical protein